MKRLAAGVLAAFACGCGANVVVEGGDGCQLAGSDPALGASAIPVVSPLRMTFSKPLDPASIEGQVALLDLGGSEVPIDVALENDDADIVITPKGSLHFWGAYTAVTGQLRAADETECAPASLPFATVVPELGPRALRPAAVSGLAVFGSTVWAASDGYSGLQVYDITVPSDVKLLSDFVTEQSPRGLVATATRAYAPAGPAGVLVLDPTSPTAPELISYGGTPGRVADVAQVDKNGKTYLLVADGSFGVRVLDVTDPGAVANVGTLSLPAGFLGISAIDVQGDTVVAVDAGKVYLLSVPDPGSPSSATLLGTLDVGQFLSDALLDGNTLFVAKSYYGLAMYDVSNPAAPIEVDTDDGPDGFCAPGCDYMTGLVKETTRLYVASSRSGVLAYATGAGQLTYTGSYDVAGAVRTVALTPSLVLAGCEEGLVVFEKNAGGAPLWMDPSGHGIARSLVVKDDAAYVADGLLGIQTFSLADPLAPELVDRDDTPGSLVADVAANFVTATDDLVLVGDGRGGLSVFDRASPLDPTLIGNADTQDAAGVMSVAGTIAYTCDSNEGLVAMDLSNPSAPTPLSLLKFTDVMGGDSCYSALAVGDRVYVGRIGGIGIVDATTPSALAWKGFVHLPSKDAMIALSRVGDHIVGNSVVFDYEGPNNQTSKLRVFSIANPDAPELRFTSDELGGAFHTHVIGDKLFVSVGLGVHVFDIADIEHPFLEGTIDTPGTAVAAYRGKDVVYVAQGAGGIQAIFTGPLPSDTP